MLQLSAPAVPSPLIHRPRVSRDSCAAIHATARPSPATAAAAATLSRFSQALRRPSSALPLLLFPICYPPQSQRRRHSFTTTNVRLLPPLLLLLLLRRWPTAVPHCSSLTLTTAECRRSLLHIRAHHQRATPAPPCSAFSCPSSATVRRHGEWLAVAALPSLIWPPLSHPRCFHSLCPSLLVSLFISFNIRIGKFHQLIATLVFQLLERFAFLAIDWFLLVSFLVSRRYGKVNRSHLQLLCPNESVSRSPTFPGQSRFPLLFISLRALCGSH